MLDADYDPDKRWQAIAAYAAQVQAVDAAVDALLESLEADGLADRTTVVVTAPRGFPVAAGRRLGHVDDALYEETAHVPLLLRRADAEGRAAPSSLADGDELLSDGARRRAVGAAERLRELFDWIEPRRALAANSSVAGPLAARRRSHPGRALRQAGRPMGSERRLA